MFRKILVAYDESPESGRALNTAIELAKAVQAELSVITVLEPIPAYYSFSMNAAPAARWTDDKKARSLALQAEACRLTVAAGLVPNAEIVSGDEIGSIIECLKRKHADLLVLGLRKHIWFMGNTAHELAERAPCALLGIK